MDLQAYARVPSWNGVLKEDRYLPLLTSRGCPYRCIFCHSIFGHKVRLRSAQDVVDELLDGHDRLGVREFHVLDDIFNVDEARAKEICQRLIDSGRRLSLAFPNGLRADRMTGELIDLLQRAGTYKLNYGFESVEPRLQELTHKRLDIPRAAAMMERTATTSIITGAYFMLGLPTETREEMERTIDFAARSRLDVAYFFKATSYPGTEFFAQGEEADPPLASFADYHFYSVQRSHSPVPVHELNALLLYAQQRFFLRGRRLWRSFCKWPRKIEFLKNLLRMLGLLLQGYILRRLLAPPVKRRSLPEASEDDR